MSDALGDPVSRQLEKLVRDCEDLVRLAAARHGLASEDVEEVFQDVRIRLWKARTDPDAIALTSRSYVYRTAVTAALDLIRRRRRELRSADVPAELEDRGVVRPDRALERIGVRDQIEGALRRLSERRRPVVRMYLAGYGREEIATLLGWSEGKARNLLYRGLSDLRGELARLGVTPAGPMSEPVDAPVERG